MQQPCKVNCCPMEIDFTSIQFGDRFWQNFIIITMPKREIHLAICFNLAINKFVEYFGSTSNEICWKRCILSKRYHAKRFFWVYKQCFPNQWKPLHFGSCHQSKKGTFYTTDLLSGHPVINLYYIMFCIYYILNLKFSS